MELIEKLKMAFPSYEVELPYSKQIVKFNPFRVKDAKNISIILQEDNKKLALNAMIDCVKDNSNIKNIESLCLADVEYLFLQIRSKSVDEILNLLVNGKPQKININNIQFKNSIQTLNIKLNDSMILTLQTPTIKDIVSSKSFDQEDYIKACLEKLCVENEIYEFNKFVPEEFKKLIDNLPLSVIKQINSFASSDPTLFVTIKNESNESEVSGPLTFFTWR
jgi:hypothetical protein